MHMDMKDAMPIQRVIQRHKSYLCDHGYKDAHGLMGWQGTEMQTSGLF